MRETLRLSPPAPMRVMAPIEDTTLANGKYFIPAGQAIVIHSGQAHRDPSVWGEDAEEFRPERMLDGKFEALPVGRFLITREKKGLCRVLNRTSVNSQTHGNLLGLV